MGTSKLIPTITMEEKKSIKNILKKPFQVLFQKDKHKKDKKKETKDNLKFETETRCEFNAPPVAVLIENIKKKEQQRNEKLKEDEDDDDEFKNFTYHVIKENELQKSAIIGSQLSSESGFDETFTNNTDDEAYDDKRETKEDVQLVESLRKLKVDDKKESKEDKSLVEEGQKGDDSGLVESMQKLKVEDKKKKQVTTVRAARGPSKKKVSDFIPNVHPYIETNNTYRQISQINTQTLSGGNLIVNEKTTLESCPELSVALTQLDRSVNDFKQTSVQEQALDFETALDFVQEKSAPIPNSSELLQHFDDPLLANQSYIYETPPRSENVPSPMSDFQAHTHRYSCGNQLEYLSPATSSPMYSSDNDKYQDILFDYQFHCDKQTDETATNIPTFSASLSPATSSPVYNSDTEGYSSLTIDYPTSIGERSNNISTSLSPSTSSPMYNSDYEKYQDISNQSLPPIPATEAGMDESKGRKEERAKRNSSSMTMKQYRDLQKEISHEFSKKLCCQVNRKPCKDIFQGYMEKLSTKDRKYLCYQVANLKLEETYGVLHHILASLSTKEDPFQMALFSLICEKVLAVKPGLFVDGFGHNLLAASVLRCRRLPVLARYLVQCVRTVTRSETYKPTNDHVFTEVNDLGDNLYIMCARAGDECADTLSELVRKEETDPPLFDIHHTNTNGYTALHVCCGPAGGASTAHVLHVLLRHAAADLWRGDIKGGDTPLHLAVNSAHCDLRIVMILFQHISIKDRKNLAHVQNRSFDTPLDYARSASKSRPKYPGEVLEFLKKCR